MASDHLRSRVAWRPAGGLQKLALRDGVAEAKVHNLDVVVRIKKKVLWLEVSVSDVKRMDVLHA